VIIHIRKIGYNQIQKHFRRYAAQPSLQFVQKGTRAGVVDSQGDKGAEGFVPQYKRMPFKNTD
jgi:hypothetical protein